ncbi:MAG: ATP-binding protein [Chloroflexi bacterium]|nr:ATP-binding protein [Chloroflexota bacterium]
MSSLHIESNTGLVGGGRLPRPGEVTLSHRGVLFLDELPECGHTVLEVLRQPIKDEVVTVSRAQGMKVTRKILNWRPRPESNRRSLP